MMTLRRLVDDEAVNCATIADGCRVRQLYGDWLMDRAADRLGYDKALMKRTERDLMNAGPDQLVSMSTDSDLVPEVRWALAEKIRKNKTVGLNAVADALCRAAGMDRPDGMLVVTATTENMFDDPEDDIKYVIKRWSDWKSSVSESFTGNLDVIIDLEDVLDEEPAAIMTKWLESSGAARVFNVMDTRTDTRRWDGFSWRTRSYTH